MTIMREKYIYIGKISAQPHTTLCIQFLNREKNDKNNTLPLRNCHLFNNSMGLCGNFTAIFLQDVFKDGGMCCKIRDYNVVDR